MISSKLTLQALMRNDLTGQADEHGLHGLKKVCFAFGEKAHIASRHLCISGRDSATGRFVLICVYRARSRLAWQTGASEAVGSVKICLSKRSVDPAHRGPV
jgi:hypothetical protein